jgi:hypothetical protein
MPDGMDSGGDLQDFPPVVQKQFSVQILPYIY